MFLSIYLCMYVCPLVLIIFKKWSISHILEKVISVYEAKLKKNKKYYSLVKFELEIC